MAHRHLHWDGDVNPDHGGFLYSIANYRHGYVEAVRITPTSDAGGPDNMFWVEVLTVNLPKSRKERANIIECAGPSWPEYIKATKPLRIHILSVACVYYGAYDVEFSKLVRIGKPDPYFEERPVLFGQSPSVVLSANAKIINYARKIAREYI